MGHVGSSRAAGRNPRTLIQVLRENPPQPLAPGERSPFDVLIEMRADER
jgi:hypothetical protein